MILAVLLVAGGVGLCLLDWRRGLLLCIAVGFLQDPLRKITPGQPVAFVVLVGVFFAACGLGFLRERGLRGLREFFGWYPGLRAPVAVFVAFVTAQSLLTVLRTDNFVLAGIGLLSYLSPLAALLLGQRYGESERAIGRWQKVYLAGAFAVAASIFAAFVGLQSPLFTSIGLERVFGRGGHVEMVAGIMRSSEIAAWHVATAACLVVIWSLARRRTRAFWLGLATALALVMAVVLTGRRKTLGEIVLFLLIYAWFLTRHRMGAARFVRLGLALAAAFVAVTTLLSSQGESGRWNPYLERSFSVVADAGERLGQMVSLQQLAWIVEENGFFGRGAGTGAQGAQYFGGGSNLVGGGAEGGLGRIVAELGVPGLLVALWLTVAVALRLLHAARWLAKTAPGHGQRFFGFVALIPANGVVFLTAHQVFGDPFVLIVLGFIASSAMAIPPIAVREGRARDSAVAPRPGPARQGALPA